MIKQVTCIAALFLLFKPLCAFDLSDFHEAYFAYESNQARHTAVDLYNNAENKLEADAALFRLTDSIVFTEENALIYSDLLKLGSNNNSVPSLYLDALLAQSSGYSAEEKSDFYTENLLTDYTLSGPYYFNSLDSFTSLTPPDSFTPPGNYKSAPVRTDLSGTVDCGAFFPHKKQNVFYYSAKAEIAESGEYIVSLGKEGFAEVYLDGKKISDNYHNHEYFPVQFFSRLILSKGKHTIVIKSAAGEKNHRLALALVPSTPGYEGVKNSSLHTPQDIYSPENETDRFNTAYLMYKTGLSYSSIAESYFASIPANSKYYKPALFYSALMSSSSAERIAKLLELHTHYPGRRSALTLSSILASEGMFSESLTYLQQAESSSLAFDITHYMYAYLFYKKGWYFKSLDHLSLVYNQHPLSVAKLRADIFFQQKRYNEALNQYTAIMKSYPRSFKAAQDYISCLRTMNDNERLQKALYSAITSFPEHIELQLMLAHSLYDAGLYDQALTVLASFNTKAPVHPESLFLQSRCYLINGNKNLAYTFANKANKLDPDNSLISQFLEHTFLQKSYLEEYQHPVFIAELEERAEQFNTEPAVLLFSDEIEKLNSDGSSLRRVRKIYKIFNSEHCKDLSKVQLVINKNTEKILSLNCRVELNGQTHSVSNYRKQSLSDPESRLYYDIELVSVDLPLFTDGCLISIDYTVQSSEGIEYNGYFGSRIYFSQSYRILHAYATVVSPSSIQLSRKLNQLERDSLVVIRKKGEILHTTTVSNQPPLLYDENSPPYFNRVPSVTYSIFKNWNDFHSWYLSLLRDRKVLTGTMKSDLTKLLSGLNSDEERISAIYTYITDRTRYVGFETGIGGVQPRSTKETYQTRLGDCKDIALLLALFLREAGYKADLALVRTSPKGSADKDIPFTGNFNHAICYVDFKGGLFLDGTVNKSSIYDLPQSDRNADALIITDSGYQFRRINPEKYSRVKDIVSTTLHLLEDGSAKMMRSLTKSGPSAVYFRNSYTTDEKRVIYLTQYWNSMYPGSRITSYKVQGLETTGDIVYSYEVLLPNFYTTGSRFSSIPSHITPVSYTKYLAPTVQRSNNLFLTNESITESTLKVFLPENYRIHSMPDAASTTAPLFSSSTNYTTGDGLFTVIYSKQIEAGIIPLSSYSEFRKKITEHDVQNSQSIILVRDEK